MSFLGKLVGRKPSQAPHSGSGGHGHGGGHGGGGGGGAADPAQSLQVLKDKMANIEKRQQFIQKKIQTQLQVAKDKQKQNDKRGALFALKTKKLYEKEIEKLDNSLMTLQSQVLAIESASVNMDVVSGMQVGHNALKNLHNQINVEKVQELQDEMHELMEDADDVGNILGQGVGATYDDEELMNELQEYEANELGSAIDDDLNEIAAAAPAKKVAAPKKAADVDLPDVPSSDVKSGAVADDDEAALAELQAQMAL